MERRDTDEPIDICEETWALAADMTCKALFDRDMPFNPHLVFNAVKAYTDVTNHRSVRFRVAEAELCELGESELAQAAQTWVELPEIVLGRILARAASARCCGSWKTLRQTRKFLNSTSNRCSTKSNNTSGQEPKRLR